MVTGEPHNYLLIPQSCGISTGKCTYTFGISLLIPKPHYKFFAEKSGDFASTSLDELARWANSPTLLFGESKFEQTIPGLVGQ